MIVYPSLPSTAPLPRAPAERENQAGVLQTRGPVSRLHYYDCQRYSSHEFEDIGGWNIQKRSEEMYYPFWGNKPVPF